MDEKEKSTIKDQKKFLVPLVPMNLVIAEKPSVAQSIARVIGATNKKDGYVEGNGYIVSWCVGHLVGLAEPGIYDEKYVRWRKEDLPIIPGADADWQYQISPSTKKQFEVLKNLFKRDDVDCIINACDAGREGELIFRLVYDKCKCKKEMKRLWISSMEDEAIQNGFENLKPGTEYEALYEAALCRERADWIVGINATRLFSCLYGQTLNVGRVMTPTLGMVVAREIAIKSFQPENFYNVVLKCDGVSLYGERMSEKECAKRLKEACEKEGKVIIKKAEKKEKMEKAPALFDLTSLQREANRKLGFTAQQTLDYTQSLYEKKLVSYPRTDSRFLTDDMENSVPLIVAKAQKIVGKEATKGREYKAVINGRKVTDHHAIVPTMSADKVPITELPAGERDVLKLICLRVLEAVSQPCVYAETTVEAECYAQIFKAKGKQILHHGWKEISGVKTAENDEKESVITADLSAGVVLELLKAECKEGKTTAPKSFTEDTLLAAMEKAGAEDMPDEAERKGLGTPATRAGVIEKLVRIGFLERHGDKKVKYLVPTQKGETLITVVPERIQSATMTAEWEQKLLEVEKEKYSSKQFMDEIGKFIKTLIRDYEIAPDAEGLMHPVSASLGACPVCGKSVVEKSKGFFCESKDCKFALWKDNHFFNALGKTITKQTAEKLLKDGKAPLKKCRSVKTGKTYDANVSMDVNDIGQVHFSLSFDAKEKGRK